MSFDWRRSGLPRTMVAGALLLALLLLSALPALAAQGTGPAPQQAATPAPGVTPNLPPQSGPLKPPDAVAGSTTFAQSCAPCHGTAGDGKGPSAAGLNAAPTAFNDFNTIAGISLSDMFQVAKNGRMDRMMPPWGQRLNDQQIWDVVGYAWTLHTSQGEVDQGQKLFESNCVACHGLDGKGKNGEPDLTDFAKTSTQTQNDWLQVIARGRGKMTGFDGKLKPEEQRAVAEYARSLSFTQLFRGALAGTGVITGTVVNGTTGQVATNFPVKLQILQQDGSSLGERTATSDNSGNYKFADLPTDGSLVFVINGEYPKGVPLQSAPASFQPGQTTLDLPFHIWETGTDASGISIERSHFIIEFGDGQIQVAELALFSNNSDRTYMGDGNAVLHFTLPQGATALDVADDPTGQRYKQVDGGFVDTMPLPPGSAVRQVLYRYSLPYSGSNFDFVRSLPYPAASVNALVTEAGEQVASDQLQNQGSRQSQMGNFINLVGQNLPANQPITIKFTNLPAPGTTTGAVPGQTAPAAPNASDRWLLIVLVVLVGVGAIGLAAWPLLRERMAPAAAQAQALDREGLIDALARLDLAHEAGQLSEAEYRDQRRVIKAQLLDLLRQEGAA